MDHSVVPVAHAQQVHACRHAVQAHAVLVVHQALAVQRAALHVDHVELALAVHNPRAAVEEGERAVALAVLVNARDRVGQVEARGVVLGARLEGVVVGVQHVGDRARHVVDQQQARELAVLRVPRQREGAVLLGGEVHRHALSAFRREDQAVALALKAGGYLEVGVAHAVHLGGTAQLGSVELHDRQVAVAVLVLSKDVHQRVVDPILTAAVVGGVTLGCLGPFVAERKILALLVRSSGVHEEALVRVDVQRRYARIRRLSSGHRGKDTLVRIVDVERAMVFDLIQVKVGLVGVAHEVPSLVVLRRQLLLIVQRDYLAALVQHARAVHVAVLADGHHVALAGDEDGLVLVCCQTILTAHIVDMLAVILMPVAVAVALQVDPVVLGLIVSVKVPLDTRARCSHIQSIREVAVLEFRDADGATKR